jgi:hypothetical protein
MVTLGRFVGLRPPVGESAGPCIAFHRVSGWSIGDVAFHDGAGGLSWLVSGSNGENLIRAEGMTRNEAWAGAVEQARVL